MVSTFGFLPKDVSSILIRNTNGFFSSLVELWFVAPKNRVRFPKKPKNDFVTQLVRVSV